jgi:hypothetical protein
MIAVIGTAAGAGPAIAWAGSTCGDEADPGQPAALEPRGAARPAPAGATARGADVQLVFFEFYDRPAALFINGRLFHQGVLRVEDETTGLSLVSRTELRGPTIFRLTSGPLDTSVTLDVTPRVRTIMINPLVAPYIWATETDSTLLD